MDPPAALACRDLSDAPAQPGLVVAPKARDECRDKREPRDGPRLIETAKRRTKSISSRPCARDRLLLDRGSCLRRLQADLCSVNRGFIGGRGLLPRLAEPENSH